MKKLFLWGLVFLALATSCQKEESTIPTPEVLFSKNLTDYSGALVNETLSIVVNEERSIVAYLSKPAGTSMDIVLGMHGGTESLSESKDATFDFATQDNGGLIFLPEGKAFLAIEYTEFESDGSIATRGFKELEDVLAAVDYLQSNPFAGQNFNIEDLYTFGSSRGGGLALLAGIERPIAAAISAEGPLDWIATFDSIRSGYLPGTDVQKMNFAKSVRAWGNPHVDNTLWVKYSPGLRVESFQSPFLVISGEADPIIMISTAEAMQQVYLDCNTCVPGSRFILHPFGHTDWDKPAIIDAIQAFVD